MSRAENRELIDQYAARLVQEFGAEAGAAIMLVLVEELGGFRITVPTMDELNREARDHRIRLLFNGANVGELAERFGLCPRQIRRIVNEG
ncbi:MAG: hypothetical protein OEV73_00205 [Desulfobulbaceae bacterium]|nr:hypothetical protein [Desulfobulbaceae bacterium]